MSLRRRWLVWSLGIAVSAAAGCRECNRFQTTPSTSAACAKGADDGVDLALEAADADFDRAHQLDCPAIRRQLACDSDPQDRAVDLAALAELRRELPGARASRAALVELMVDDDQAGETTATVAAALSCAPLEREIATRRWLAAHPDQRPAQPGIDAEVQP